MNSFFGEDVLLSGTASKEIYSSIKDLPIIDYHCHLDQTAIQADKKFTDIGELWLAGDHYKWRAMRSCGRRSPACALRASSSGWTISAAVIPRSTTSRISNSI